MAQVVAAQTKNVLEQKLYKLMIKNYFIIKHRQLFLCHDQLVDRVKGHCTTDALSRVHTYETQKYNSQREYDVFASSIDLF